MKVILFNKYFKLLKRKSDTLKLTVSQGVDLGIEPSRDLCPDFN
jgi:hypothetical protein